jgi:hypothetical protein
MLAKASLSSWYSSRLTSHKGQQRYKSISIEFCTETFEKTYRTEILLSAAELVRNELRSSLYHAALSLSGDMMNPAQGKNL